MAGTLTPQDERFAELVARDTGLELPVVRAWVQAENGPAGNPLNIGPGRDYGSTEQAAAATVHLLRHPRYAAIMGAARGSSVREQFDAITHSPWDAGHYRDGKLLLGAHAALYGPKAIEHMKPEGGNEFGLQNPLDAAADSAGRAASAVVDGALGPALSWLGGNAAKATLHVAFTALALALIFVGLNKTTGGVPGQAALMLASRGRARGRAPASDIPF